MTGTRDWGRSAVKSLPARQQRGCALTLAFSSTVGATVAWWVCEAFNCWLWYLLVMPGGLRLPCCLRNPPLLVPFVSLPSQFRSPCLPPGADVRATTKDGDTVFTSLIFLLGEGVCSSTEEARVTNGFCFRVAQLLLAHGANPSECPAPESLTHLCLSNFKHHFSLLRFLLESGAAYNCCLHGPACWSGFQLVFECLCSHLSVPEDDSFYADLMQKGQTLLELMMASSQAIRLPSNFEVNTSGCRYHGDKVRTLFCSLKQLEHTPQALKHLCRVFIRQRLKPWPVDVKIKALPLPDRLKWYLLIDHAAVGHEDL